MKQTILLLACSSLTAIGATVMYMNDDKESPSKQTQERLQPQLPRIEKVIVTIPATTIETSDTLQVKPIFSTDLYLQAVDEVEDMLEGRKPLSFKRAVFLYENAYFDGKLNWQDFCDEIDKIKVKLDQMIVNRNMSKFKTAAHWAIFNYMTDTIPENDFKPYRYDLENLINDRDFESFTVASLLKNRLGNCHSLPYLYKILADEMKTEAFISLAPMHVFIKHKDEQDKWWNLELTSGTFSRTSFIIESFNVSDEGLESGLYMKPLSDKESVALCLNDLLYCYDKYKGVYSGPLVSRAYTIGIKHYPNSLLQVSKCEDKKYKLDEAMKAKGLKNYDKARKDPKLAELYDDWEETMALIKRIGFRQMSDKEYLDKVLEIRGVQTAQAKK